MIRFVRREDYALVIVGMLAHEYKKRPVPLSLIAKEYEISLLFLRNLANELRDAGVIKAIEGKDGGYYLTKNPRRIKMGEILRIFSKGQDIACCPLGKKGSHKRRCPKKKSCLAGNTWRRLNKEFIDRVHKLSLQDFLEYKSSAGGGPSSPPK